MQKKEFEGFDYKDLDYSAFIDTKETLIMTEGGIDVTGSVANFNNDWDKDIEEFNEFLNETFRELNAKKKN
jgi:hypothetical protein